MKTGLVVTTIQGPNEVMRSLAAQAAANQAPFFVLGDRKSPPQYELAGATYFGLEAQHAHFGAFSKQLPVGHYVRKNLGYLAALDAGCEWIVETDDDNYPLQDFFRVPPASLRARLPKPGAGWINAYRYFTPTLPIWPRGFPLEALAAADAAPMDTTTSEEKPLLVQALANDNPDVDAVYRLTRPLPVNFGNDAPLALAEGQWCPFNSQATWHHRRIAALLYLPAHCSFRMTDIWRSFVAQRCLWAMGSRLVFVAPTVRQERNEHNLLRDFQDEVPGYLNNEKIRKALDACKLAGEPAADLVRCYEALVQATIIPADELPLVRAWVGEVERRANAKAGR